MRLLEKVPGLDEDELFEVPEMMSSSIFKNVFRVSDKVLVKIEKDYFGDEMIIDNPLAYEFAVQKALHQAGISVPYPIGMFEFQYPGRADSQLKGIFMEYIKGTDLSKKLHNPNALNGKHLLDLFRSRLPNLAKEAETEISKAQNLGFHPAVDSLMPYNLRLSENGRLFLIDFGLWSHQMIKPYPRRELYEI